MIVSRVFTQNEFQQLNKGQQTLAAMTLVTTEAETKSFIPQSASVHTSQGPRIVALLGDRIAGHYIHWASMLCIFRANCQNGGKKGFSRLIRKFCGAKLTAAD